MVYNLLDYSNLLGPVECFHILDGSNDKQVEMCKCYEWSNYAGSQRPIR